jgi:hypothetical protein
VGERIQEKEVGGCYCESIEIKASFEGVILEIKLYFREIFLNIQVNKIKKKITISKEKKIEKW